MTSTVQARAEAQTPTPSPYFNRELSWLRFQRARPVRGDGRAHAAPRAREVPGDRQHEPRRVLHGPGRRGASVRSPRGCCSRPPTGSRPWSSSTPSAAESRSCSSACRRCSPTCSTSLGAYDIRLVDIESLSAPEFSALDDYFEREVFPVLTPLAVDPGHPFPYISNLSLSLAVEAARYVERDASISRASRCPRASRDWCRSPARRRISSRSSR